VSWINNQIAVIIGIAVGVIIIEVFTYIPTWCSVKKGTASFSTITLAFLDRFLRCGCIACNAECCNSYGNSVCLSVCSSVRPSVRLSHAGIVPRQLKIGSHVFTVR